MKNITSYYKTNVKEFGRQIDSKIHYVQDGVTIELGKEQLNSVTPHYESQILKSTMKQLDIDSNVDIPVETVLNYRFGVLVDDEYEYINYGNYVVYSSEKQEDTNSYKIICYDKMLYSMKDYTPMNITYPITIRSYLQAICDTLGLTFKNAQDTFTNYDKEIPNELYIDADGKSLGYKFRDVLDELAQTTGSTICINEDDDSLEIRYINDLIDETTEVEGNPITITDNEEEKPLDIQLKGNTIQDSYSGANLYNYQDTTTVSSGVTTDENGWITATKNNTSGTSTSYLNYYTNNLNLQTSTQYAIFLEVKAVSGNGELYVTSLGGNNGQFSDATNVQLSSLHANDILKFTPTTKSSFDSIANGLRTYLREGAGQSGSITFRISVLADTTVTTDNFVYQPYVGGTPSPNPDYPQSINNVTGEQVVEIVGKNLYDPSYRRQNGTIYVVNGTGTESDGTFTLTATGSDLYIWNVISAGKKYDESRGQLYEFKEDSYTVSISNQLFTKNFVTYYDEHGVSLGYTQKANTTFNVLKSAKAGAKYFSLRLGYGQAVSGTSYSFTVQLEKGIVSSPVYEPYIGHTYKLNLGKNLFDKDNLQGHFFYNSNTYLPNATNLDWNCSNFIKVKSNTQYTISLAKLSTSSVNCQIIEWDKDKNGVANVWGNIENRTITTKSNTAYLTIAYNNTIYTNAQVEKGSKATSYSPYFTPIELCKTQDGQYQDVIKKSTGKNLLNLSNKIVGYGFDNTNNIVVISSVHDIYYIPVEAGKTYVSSAVLGTSSGNIAYAYSSEIPQENTPVTGRTTTAISTLNNGTFIVPTGEKYLLIRITRESQVLTNWQIEEGSQATTYEPYGKVWYKYSEIGSIVLDGSETGWQYADNYNYFRCPNYDFKGQIPLSTTEGQRNQLSTHFRLNWHWSGTDSFRDNINVQGEFFSIMNANYKICIRNTNYTTTQDLKTWLASALPKIQYILETPTYEIITDTELIGQLENIRLLTGLNNISLSSDGTLKLKYINEYETIDEYYLKDVNVTFGEKYGPVNSIVLSRSAGADNIYLRDEESVTLNGLCEIKIADNQIMNGNNRDEYLQGLLDRLNGLNYYLNDYTSTGITFYELCDRYRVKIGDIKYPCVMFNDETLVTQGLQENIHTDMLEETQTDYSKADKTDRRLNQTTLIVDKQNQKIQSVVTQIGDRSEKQTTITQDIDSIESQIQDIPTITTESEGVGERILNNLANTKLAELRVHPTATDIIGLFASPLLKASTTLKALSRGVTFDSEKDTYYKIPDNLYFYEDVYDEFVYDGLEEKIYIVKRIDVDGQGNKSVLQEPVTIEYEYEDIMINEGDYNIFMSSYPDAYIYVKAMIKNDYTDTFATKLELESSITQTATSIMSQVNRKVDSKEFSTAIKQTAHSIALTATDNQTSAGLNIKLYNEDGTELDSKDANITMTGLVKFTDLSGTGTTTINGSNITTGTIEGITLKGNNIEGGTITSRAYSSVNDPYMNVINPQSTQQAPIETRLWGGGIYVYDYRGDEPPVVRTETASGYAELSGIEVNAWAFNNISLEEKKKNFEKLENALNIIKDTDIYKYNYKGEENKDKKHIGLIIGKNYNYSNELTNKENNAVDLYSMTAVCLKAIKEQQNQIELLKQEISLLKGEDK